MKYVIGLDFGTLSARAVLVSLDEKYEIGSADFAYPHGVMDRNLPTGRALPIDFALQHPADYLEALQTVIPEVLKTCQISAEDVIGLGFDFTSCTLIPINNEGMPLCLLPEFEDEPHAYVKLWKHHAAGPQADRVNETAARRKEKWLSASGGRVSPEWTIPKGLEILEHAPEVYQRTYKFIEGGDWLVYKLTGHLAVSISTAGYRCGYSEQLGYPPKEFLKELHPDFENFAEGKLVHDILEMGAMAGELDDEGAKLTGLRKGIPVATANIDCHSGAIGCGVSAPGKLAAILGTAAGFLVLADREIPVEGICGFVEGGIIPGYFGYEAGLPCVGDLFSWFVKNCLPRSYEEEAQKLGVNVHQVLREKAKCISPGESGLIALDWWNGNRSILDNNDLSGLVVGMTLRTRPEEIYRALLEATAYGTRMIIENFERYGIRIDEIVAAGGIAQKDELMMQIFADVTGRTIHICASKQASGLGAAICAALAVGEQRGGFSTAGAAVNALAKILPKKYRPISENATVYNKLYAEYVKLHDYFGNGENDVMLRLKAIKTKMANHK